MKKETILIFEAAVTGGPAKQSDVEATAKTIGCKFPEAYVEFLCTFGAALVGGYDIYGILDTSVPRSEQILLSVKEQTAFFRHRFAKTDQDMAFIPISSDGMSNDICIDTRFSPATRIVAIGPNVGCKRMFDSFDDFVLFLTGDMLIDSAT